MFFVDLHVSCIAIVLLRAVGSNDKVVELIFINGMFFIWDDRDFTNEFGFGAESSAFTLFWLFRLMTIFARLGACLPGQSLFKFWMLLLDLLVRRPRRWELVADLVIWVGCNSINKIKFVNNRQNNNMCYCWYRPRWKWLLAACLDNKYEIWRLYKILQCNKN